MTTADPMVRLVALGGLGEFGLHMMLLETAEDVIAIDCGFMFPNDDMPGVDYAIPDFSYLQTRRERFRAVFLTHAHYDHIGALSYLLREMHVPVYGTALTLGILAKMLREHNILDVADLRPLRARDVIEVGTLRVEAIRVTHSVADGVGFAVGTPVGTVFHTGDFKLDESPVDGQRSDLERLTELSREGVVCLLSDSTNVERPGHARSESDVGQSLKDVFGRAPGRIIVSTFATHIHRIQQIIEIAGYFKRKVALLGRSIVSNVNIAQDLGYLTVPDGALVDLKALEKWPRREQVIISTGSQGEPYSAMALMAAGQHRAVAVAAGDVVMMSARVIPGNERHVATLISQLFRLGADVLYEAMDFVHASGHACQEDLKAMLNLVRPKYFIPVHGELRHLVHHGRLAESVGISPDRIFVIEDGRGLDITSDGAHVSGPFPAGKIFVQGKGVGDIGAVVLRDRQILSQDGVVSVSLVVDSHGAVVAGPEIASRGFVYVKENEELLGELRAAVLDALAGRDAELAPDREALGALVRSAVRHFINQRFQRKPVVLPVILQV